MLGAFINIEVDGEEIQKIFADIKEAERTIRGCYARLAGLGVVKIKAPQSKDEVIEDREGIETTEI